MYSLISKEATLSRGIKVDQNVDRLLTQHRINTEKQVAWYKTNYKEVDGRNPLVRLAYGILSYKQDTPMLAYQTAKNFMNELAGPLGITTDIHEGKTHYEFFNGTPTAIIGLDRSNPAEVFVSSNNYETLAPVKVVHAPTARDNLVRPDLAEHEYGFGVITIDIPLFAMGLTQWYKQNMKKPEDKREDLKHYLGRWVFPNMLYSQADNYLLAALEANNEDELKSSTVQMLPDVAKDFFKEINEFKANISKANTIEDVLKTLPATFRRTQYDALNFPTAYVPKQSHWAKSAQFLRPIKVAMQIATDNQDGRALKNKWKREQRRLQQEKTYSGINDELMKTELTIYEMDIQQLFEQI